LLQRRSHGYRHRPVRIPAGPTTSTSSALRLSLR
jgi:hypothetical protein